MPPNAQLRIQRKAEVARQLGICLTTLRTRIIDGLYPPPISLGARAVGWLSCETNAVIAAIAAGQSDDDIRELVKSLVARRVQLGKQYDAK